MKMGAALYPSELRISAGDAATSIAIQRATGLEPATSAQGNIA